MLISEAWAAAIKPRDRRPIYEWAGDNVDLKAPYTRKGMFSVAETRHLISPFDSLHDEHCREINVKAPVRGGKSLLADMLLASSVARDPGPFRWVWQDDQNAMDHAKTRAFALLRDCPACQAVMPTDRHRDNTQEILLLTGDPLIIRGPSKSQLQSKGFRYMVLDECWLYKAGTIEEARGRLGDYLKLENSKLLCISQGGDDGTDWAVQYAGGEQNEWHIQCLNPQCGHYMLPRWGAFRPDGSRWGMIWDEIKKLDGSWNVERCSETVRYECEKCGYQHENQKHAQSEWNRTGKYVLIGEPNRRVRSFHWSAVIDSPWGNLCRLWLAARNAAKKGAYLPTVQFFQKYMAEDRSEGTVMTEGGDIATSRYDPLKPFDGDDEIRIMTIDRQEEDLFWVTVRAWTKDGRSRRIWFGKLFGFAAVEAKREELGVKPNLTGCDSGYKPKGDNGVYAACAQYGWFALKGVATDGGEDMFFWHADKKGRKTLKSYAPLTFGDPESGAAAQGKARKARLIRFSAPTYKDRVRRLIELRLWQEPEADREDELEAEYRRQMWAEYKKPRVDKFSGRTRNVYVCPSGNNHAFDCSSMQILFAINLDILPDEIADTAAAPLTSKAA